MKYAENKIQFILKYWLTFFCHQAQLISVNVLNLYK